VESIEANLAAQEECVRTGDRGRSVHLDEEYHILLNGCLGNQEIMRVILQARDRMFRVIQRVPQNHPERLETNYPEHRAVFQAILAGEGDAAAALMREHLEHGQQFLMDTRLGQLGPASKGADGTNYGGSIE
jgi:DNA-binding GntR family transcriptional regulator